MLDWSSRSENPDLMVSQGYVLSFALTPRQSDRTSSFHRSGIRYGGQLLAPSTAFAVESVLVAATVLGSVLGSVLVDDSPAVEAAAAQLSAFEESVSSLGSAVYLDHGDPCALLARTAGHDGTRMSRVVVTSFGRQD